MEPEPFVDRLSGLLQFAITALVILSEWQGHIWFGNAAAGLVTLLIALLAMNVGWTRMVFVAVGLALTATAVATSPGWLASVNEALQQAAFIAAFFTALTTLRHAADTSPIIQTSGRFLAQQPPGRRYAALTLGGQLFGLLLNYGAIALLGSLALANARQEQNAEIRAHRIRRMLLAIQRGFLSTLPWSPLAFAMAISTSLVPGATWAGALLPCLVSGLILAGLGWALDTIFKPRLTTAVPARTKPEGSWASLFPLVGLLGILVVSVSVLHILTGIRAVAVVIVVVPIIAAAWIGLQSSAGRRLRDVRRRVVSYMWSDLPGYRGELVLLMMAAFIGTLGSVLLGPVFAAWGIDFTVLPSWLLLVALVWIIPLTGQLGMNPILSVSLIAPILPDAARMGISPNDFIVAITAGWALGGASSPYTATTLLVGSFGSVSATHVGIRWNGAYTLLSAVVLSAWVGLLTMF